MRELSHSTSSIGGVATALVLLTCLLPSAAGASDDPDRSFLWRADRGGRSVYLLGSIHFMKPDAYPLSPAIETAYSDSEVLVFETDIEGLQRAAVGLMAEGTLADGTTLDDVVSPELRRKLDARFDALGLGASAFERMKPWMIALSLTSMELMRAGYLSTEGIDAHFNARAQADGKEQRGLETPDEQIALFADLSAQESAAFLDVTLTELETVIPLVDRIVTAWKAGDATAIESILTESFEEHPALYRRMVTDRNRRWLPQVEALFDGPADAMVVVGSLHLVGDEGLVELLRAKGYEVSQL